MTLRATEFLRRFVMHVLLKGFVRVRSFGFLANHFRAQLLALWVERPFDQQLQQFFDLASSLAVVVKLELSFT
jgi:hypothetical protein